MVAGARTFSLEDTFLEPQALRPPPTRHALFLFLLALAVLLHFGTIGWGELSDGVEGQFAGGARAMLQTQQWLSPTINSIPAVGPPLTYWLIAASYKLFGISAAAARVPIALAMVASIALTFLIGEKLSGYWRGFMAGLLHLGFCGAFLFGRMVASEPIFNAFIEGAIFCLVCGYQRRRFRWLWFTGFWLGASLACLTQGAETIFYLAGICLLLTIFFREARLRFRLLTNWPYLLFFVLLVSPWYLWIKEDSSGSLLHSIGLENITWPRLGFVVLHFVWWFPASILVLPGLLLSTRKIIRPQEVTFSDVLPLCWLAVGFLPLLLGSRTIYSGMTASSAFALWAAAAWDRSPERLRLFAMLVLIFIGATIAAVSQFSPDALSRITSDATWTSVIPMAKIAGAVLLGFSAVAFILEMRRRPEIALIVLGLSMVPIGLCIAEGAARMAPTVSLATAARFLNPRLGENGTVVYEGPLSAGSSLSFYLNRKFYLANQQPEDLARTETARQKYVDEKFVLEKWNQPDPIYLIIDQTRVAHWQKVVTERIHIYHQVTTCGRHVVLSNQL